MSNPFDIVNKTVLITGASSGIGKGIALLFSKLGAKLIITGRNEQRLKETYQSLDGEGHIMHQCDFYDSKQIDSFVNSLEHCIDGLVHSAGVSFRLPVKFINEKKFSELMHVNFYTPAILTTKLYNKKLLGNGASVVFISSVAANYASLGSIMYMSSKGAVNSLMKGLAFELARTQTRVNSIQPGMIKTNLTTTLSDDLLLDDLKNYPLGRYGTPDDVANACVYLISDASTWMTGSVMTIDGGLTLR